MTRLAKMLYNAFIRPHAQNEDVYRREFILNTLLAGSLMLAGLALLLIILTILSGAPLHQTRFVIVLAVVGVFGGLLALSRQGFIISASYIFIILYFGLGTYTLWLWGINLPSGLLIYSLVIVMSGILLGATTSFVMVFVMLACLMTISYLQTRHYIPVDLGWTEDLGRIIDAISFAITLGIIAVVSWLSNREIEKSLARALRSEAALQKERDLLEVKVEERTQELKRTQIEKLSELSTFAEVGQLAAGIIHDLANPLATVSFSLEQLNGIERSALVARALKGTEYMKRYINTARKQIQHEDSVTTFSIVQEIQDAIQMLSYKAKQANVTVELQAKVDRSLHGSPARFDQLIANLLANAIDAYALNKTKPHNRKVVIEFVTQPRKSVITIRDWAGGIPKEVQKHIFEPFFTTKGPQKGTGIGLMLCKSIAEKDFGGSIGFQIQDGQGTAFIIELPVTQTSSRSS